MKRTSSSRPECERKPKAVLANECGSTCILVSGFDKFFFRHRLRKIFLVVTAAGIYSQRNADQEEHKTQ
jgi:hypothetical protein